MQLVLAAHCAGLQRRGHCRCRHHRVALLLLLLLLMMMLLLLMMLLWCWWLLLLLCGQEVCEISLLENGRYAGRRTVPIKPSRNSSGWRGERMR